MIRGALVFASGLAVGYAKAVSETEAINNTVNTVVEKAKKAWDEADVEYTGLKPEGVDFLMKRLRDALPYAKVSDDTPIIRGEAGEAVLTMGDLRAPFSVPPTSTNAPEGESPQ